MVTIKNYYFTKNNTYPYSPTSQQVNGSSNIQSPIYYNGYILYDPTGTKKIGYIVLGNQTVIGENPNNETQNGYTIIKYNDTINSKKYAINLINLFVKGAYNTNASGGYSYNYSISSNSVILGIGCSSIDNTEFKLSVAYK